MIRYINELWLMCNDLSQILMMVDHDNDAFRDQYVLLTFDFSHFIESNLQSEQHMIHPNSILIKILKHIVKLSLNHDVKSVMDGELSDLTRV